MSHEKHSWTTELTLDRFVRETGHSKHMLHLTVWHCVMLWVDVSANCPFQGSTGWELKCGNWQVLFVRAHIRKYHLRETKLSCPRQKCSDFLQGVLKILSQFVRWGYGPSGSCCYCAAGCTSKVMHALGFLWFLLTTFFAIHPLEWILSQLNFWSVNLDPFLSTLKMEASCCFRCQGQLTLLKGGIMRATTWMAWKFENTI